MISSDTFTIFMLTFSKYKPYKILISKDPTWSCLLDDTKRLLFPPTCLWDNTKQFAHVSPWRVISRASKRERVRYNNVREMKLLQVKRGLFLISLKSPSLVSSRSIYSRLFFSWIIREEDTYIRIVFIIHENPDSWTGAPVTERFLNSIFSQVL